jgi:DUF4097 and DUF4098 domain-containing protein YvlB
MGTFTATGALGRCDLKSGGGDVRIEEVAGLRLSTAAGSVTLDRVTGDASVSSAAGDVRIGRVDGNAVVKGAVGAIRLGEVRGELRASTASGGISADRALGSVVAKTAVGKVLVGEVTRGSVVLESGGGAISIGIPEGTAAWVDARSFAGTVRNGLEPTEAPQASGRAVEIRARTAFGDIAIHRSSPRLSEAGRA